MKVLKKICLIYLCILIILTMFSGVFASDLKTSLTVVQNASEKKYLENDQGFISKTIVNSN